MADLSQFAADGLRDLMFRTAAGFSKPAAGWVSFHVGDPGLTGDNEVVGGSYARVQRDPGDANWTDDAVSGTAKNVATITFPAPSADWGLITHAGYWSAPTGGNFLCKAVLSVPKLVSSGAAAPNFLPNQLVFVFI